MRAWVVGASLACAAAAHSDEVLLVGDPAAEAIYERGLDEGRGPARLVSGRIGFLADRIASASNRFTFYTVGARVLQLDRTDGSIVEIYTIPGLVNPARITAGPGENLLSLAMDAGTSVRILSGSRPAAGQPWSFVDPGVAIGVLSFDGPHLRDFAQLDAGRWVLVLGGSFGAETRVLLATAANPASPLTIQTFPFFPDHALRIDRRQDGNWILFSARGSVAATIHDPSGTLLKTIAMGSGTAFDAAPLTMDWTAGMAEIVTRTGIVRTDDPLTATPTATPLHTFLLENGRLDPQRDLNDAVDFRRNDVGGWQVAREAAGFLADVSGTTGESSAVVSISRGAGPPLGTIIDMVAADGKLWVLCGTETPQSVFEVDRASGTRIVHAVLAGEKPFDAMARSGDGTLLFSRGENRGTPPTQERWHVVRRIASITEDGSALLETAAEGQGRGIQVALWLDSQQRPVVATHPLDGPYAWRGDGSALEPLPGLSLSAPAAWQIIPSSMLRVSGQMQWPAVGAPTNSEHVQISVTASTTSTTSFSGVVAARIILADATVVPAQGFVQRDIVESATPPNAYRATIRVAMPATPLPPGTWTVEFDFSPTAVPADVAWQTVQLHARPIAGLTAMAAVEDSTALALRHKPPRLAAIELDTGSASHVALSAADAFLGPRDLEGISEITVDPASGAVFAGIGVGSRVMQIDRQTGACMEFVSGRPAEIDASLLNLENNARLSLAIAPAVESVAAVESLAVY